MKERPEIIEEQGKNEIQLKNLPTEIVTSYILVSLRKQAVKKSNSKCF